MTKITTVVTPDDLPVGSVVMTETLDGFGSLERRVWMRHGGGDSGLLHDWQATDGGFQRMGAEPHARDLWALNRRVIVLYRPDAVLVIPGQNPGKPTAEAVADALIQYETGGICHYGQTCGLCDCGKADETPEQTQTRDAMELDRARAVLALIPPQRCAPSEAELSTVLIGCLGRDDYLSGTVRAITKLYADQPTVAQAKAEALREVADELDRDAAEGSAARRVAGVRCLRCDLRHEEREEYSCQIEGTAHDYDDSELAEAARPDSETSWISDRLRARANDIESGAEHG